MEESRSEARDSSSEPPVSANESRKRARTSRYNMYEDIEDIMYGFGDKWPPNPDSVELMEKIAVQYIRDLCAKANQTASVTGGKIDKECFLFQVRLMHG